MMMMMMVEPPATEFKILQKRVQTASYEVLAEIVLTQVHGILQWINE